MGLCLVISEYALKILWIRQFYLLTKNRRKTHQMPPNSTKILKFSRRSIPPHPAAPALARLHENDLQDSFCMSLWKKLGFSLVVSKYALKYAGLDSSICSPKIPKRHIRCRRTIPSRFQNLPGGACPRTPLSRLHENDLQDSFLHESVEKAGFISCNIRICSENTLD